MQARTERADQDADDDRAARQSQLYGQADARNADGDAPQHQSQNQSDEDRHEIGFVEVLDGVAENLLDVLDRRGFADDRQAVAHLEPQVGRCEQLHARTVDAADVDAVVVAQAQ